MNQILVVEDDRQDCELLLAVLAKTRLQVTICETAARARELFEVQHFSAVLVNLLLPQPEPDGLQLIRWLRQRSPRLLIVVVTGLEDPRKREQAIEAGATGFFEKPYTSADNWLLLSQMEVERAAYAEGKRLKHRLTNLFGALENIGTGLIGLSVVPSLTSMAAAEELKWVTVAGFILQIVGKQLFAASAADARTVNEHLRACAIPPLNS